MYTYKTSTIHESISTTLKQLNKKFDKKINFIKLAWQDIAPDWAKQAVPYTIKHKTLIFHANTNALILKFKEKELLNIIKLILPNQIDSIKIIYKLH